MSDNKVYFAGQGSGDIQAKIEKVKAFLAIYGGGPGLTEADIPACPANVLKPTETAKLILVVYLPSPAATLQAILDTLNAQDGYVVDLDSDVIIDDEHLKLNPAITQKIGIFWLVYDGEANKGLSPKDCQENTETAPFLAAVECLFALYEEDGYNIAINNEEEAEINLSGYLELESDVDEDEDEDDTDDDFAEEPEEGIEPAEGEAPPKEEPVVEAAAPEPEVLGEGWYKKVIYVTARIKGIDLSLDENITDVDNYANPTVVIAVSDEDFVELETPADEGAGEAAAAE